MHTMPAMNAVASHQGTSSKFAVVAGLLADAARAWGVRPPGYRSPPARPGINRSLRRELGGVVIAVRVAGRPFDAVVVDMVDGLFAVHPGCDSPGRRRQVWALLADEGVGRAPLAA